MAFQTLRMPETVAFTAAENLQSIRVMEQPGMKRDRQEHSEHPAVTDVHLQQHVLYRATQKPPLRSDGQFEPYTPFADPYHPKGGRSPRAQSTCGAPASCTAGASSWVTMALSRRLTLFRQRREVARASFFTFGGAPARARRGCTAMTQIGSPAFPGRSNAQATAGTTASVRI